MGKRTATCSCGQLRVTVADDPVRVSICHCLACQQRTGSVFGVQARWPADQVTTEGETRVWRRIGDEAVNAEFHKCQYLVRLFRRNLKNTNNLAPSDGFAVVRIDDLASYQH